MNIEELINNCRRLSTFFGDEMTRQSILNEGCDCKKLLEKYSRMLDYYGAASDSALAHLILGKDAFYELKLYVSENMPDSFNDFYFNESHFFKFRHNGYEYIAKKAELWQ